MKVLCVFGEHNYGDPKRGNGYEFMNFLPAFKAMGHEVIFFDSCDRTQFKGFAELNRGLLELVERAQPDVVFYVPFLYELWSETWELIKKSNTCTTIAWTTDDSWKYEESSRFIAPSFHAITTTYKDAFEKYQRDGHSNVFLTQWAADGECQEGPLPARDCRYPVSFVGTINRVRENWVSLLKQANIDVACFGHGWPNGAVTQQQIREIVRGSVISLNFSHGLKTLRGTKIEHKNQLKARVFEVPGSGGFLLTETAPGLERYYEPEKEISVFHNLAELTERINYYLAHPDERDRVAWAGFERTRREHTYRTRFEEVIAFALRKRNESPDATARTAIDWNAFEHAVLRHRRSLPLSALRFLLVTPGRIVWGKKRGERAARRLLFEVGWRLSGAHIYSAAGWPGRLFYKAS